MSFPRIMNGVLNQCFISECFTFESVSAIQFLAKATGTLIHFCLSLDFGIKSAIDKQVIILCKAISRIPLQ